MTVNKATSLIIAHLAIELNEAFDIISICRLLLLEGLIKLVLSG